MNILPKHAKLAPSAATRWMRCPGSIKMEENNTSDQNKVNPAASEGTNAHAYAQLIFEEAIKQGLKSELNDDIRKAVESSSAYVELTKSDFWNPDIPDITFERYCKIVWSKTVCKHPDGYLGIEEFIDCRPVLKETYGTADYIFIGGGKLSVIDFKFGFTPVTETKQQLIYAFGAYLKYYKEYKIDKIDLVIIQPRLNNDEDLSELLSVSSLIARITGDVIPASNKALMDDAPCIASDIACAYCKGSHMCNEYLKFVKKVTEVVLSDSMLLKEHGDFMLEFCKNFASLKNCYSLATNQLMTRIKSGEKIPGVTIVERKMWKWKLKDPQAVSDMLVSHGMEVEKTKKWTNPSPAEIRDNADTNRFFEKAKANDMEQLSTEFLRFSKSGKILMENKLK